VIGTSVTVLAALWTRQLRTTGKPWLAAIPPIALNGLIIPIYISTLTLPQAADLHLKLSLGEAIRFALEHFSWNIYLPVALWVLIGEAAVVILLGLPVLALVRHVASPVKEV
ncbi:MAG: QueT transporter family protein, partial [Candidatus Cryosericum sp.]